MKIDLELPDKGKNSLHLSGKEVCILSVWVLEKREAK
jgi:hypothetical protein